MTNSPAAPEESASVALFDARPFFEKALVFGVQHGLIDEAKLAAICTDAPKGMVQIARYFGNEFLRPELEKAKDRMVNLISLHLEDSSNGDLQLAAQALRDHSFLSRSKAGSDMLKQLIAMPQTSHFGMNEHGGFQDEHIPLLAKWALRSLTDYRTEFQQRQQFAQIIDAALWLAEALGLEAAELEDAGKDAEAVIRTALLAMALKKSKMPDWPEFEKMILALRKKQTTGKAIAIDLPKALPLELIPVVQRIRTTVMADLPKILDGKLPTRKLFDQTPAFMGRYFWVEDSLREVDHYHRSSYAAWDKITGGHADDSSLVTLFLCVAAQQAPKTLLTEKAAISLIKKIRKNGLQSELVGPYIQEHAPAHAQQDYSELWQGFVDEAQTTLQSDFDYQLQDALALLRRECNVS
jgi:hypothetical protein